MAIVSILSGSDLSLVDLLHGLALIYLWSTSGQVLASLWSGFDLPLFYIWTVSYQYLVWI